MLSRVWLFVTPWTIAHQAPLSMEFSRQEYWSRLSFPSPGDLPDPGIEPASPESSALAGEFFTTEPPGNPCASTLLNFWFINVFFFLLNQVAAEFWQMFLCVSFEMIICFVFLVCWCGELHLLTLENWSDLTFPRHTLVGHDILSFLCIAKINMLISWIFAPKIFLQYSFLPVL